MNALFQQVVSYQNGSEACSRIILSLFGVNEIFFYEIIQLENCRKKRQKDIYDYMIKNLNFATYHVSPLGSPLLSRVTLSM